ncbi:MAG: hypothetical protein ABR537_12325 [Gemmatimonadales bacterium]
MVDRVPTIRSPVDLDLALFLFRHPYAMLTDDRLATTLGRDAQQVAASLDKLIKAGIVERGVQSPHQARMHAFSGAADEALVALLRAASTRTGRLAVLQALENRMASGERTSGNRHDPSATPDQEET